MKVNIAASVVIAGSAVFFGGLFLYSLATGTLPYIWAGLGALSLLLVISLRLPVKYRIILAVCVFSTGFTLISAEVILKFDLFSGGPAGHRQPFDLRDRFEVVKDLRSSGIDAYPVITGRIVASNSMEIDTERLFPLAGIAAKTTVYCNELGEYLIYESDEHGFNNPPGIWSQSRIDLVAIGDSFTHGACVRSGSNAIDLIREVHGNTLNLGLSEASPILEMALIREYVLSLKPRAVLWFFYEGDDLHDLLRDLNAPLIRQYLNPDYRQNLISRQSEIDDALRHGANILLDSKNKQPGSSTKDKAFSMIKLSSIRDRFSSALDTCWSNIPEPPHSEFESILRDAKQTTNDLEDTDLYFVYLPAWDRYGDPGSGCNGKIRVETVQAHDRILSMVEGLNITVIDLVKEFDAHPDPLSLWPYRRLRSHYNQDGYRLVADTVLESISVAN